MWAMSSSLILGPAKKELTEGIILRERYAELQTTFPRKCSAVICMDLAWTGGLSACFYTRCWSDPHRSALVVSTRDNRNESVIANNKLPRMIFVSLERKPERHLNLDSTGDSDVMHTDSDDPIREILYKEIRIPPFVSEEADQILRAFLRRNPDERSVFIDSYNRESVLAESSLLVFPLEDPIHRKTAYFDRSNLKAGLSLGDRIR